MVDEAKPAFDPSQPFEAASEQKPAFDPSQPFEAAPSQIDKATLNAKRPFYQSAIDMFTGAEAAGAAGMKEGWGGEPMGISEKNKQILRDAGFFRKGEGDRYNPFKAFNELLAETVVRAGETFIRGPNALFRGAQAETYSLLSNIDPQLARDIAAMPEAFLGSPHPTGVPKPFVKPTPVEPVKPAPPSLRPRTELGKIGDPIVDSILDHPTMHDVINNGVVDRSHDVPNSWGASSPMENPATYIDSTFPRELTVNGVTFDPADAALLRENAEAFAVEKLMAAGMSRDEAISFAFWEVGNRVEDAWYEAHGMNPVDVEAALKPIVDRIAARKPDPAKIPSDVFKETYPNGDPLEDSPGVYPKPTPELISRARNILAGTLVEDAMRLPRGPDLTQARDLGVIGPEAELPKQEESPAVQAQRDVPARTVAAARRDEKIMMTPRGEPIDAYQQRFAEWVSKIKDPGDIDDLIAKAAAENDYFPQARQGEIPPAQIDKLAKASGWDSINFDPALLRTRFHSDAEIRAVEQVLIQTRDDYRAALAKARDNPSPENLAAAAETKSRHESALEYVAAFRSDWGKSGLAQQEFLKRERRREQSAERSKVGMPKEGNDLIAAVEEFSDAATKDGLEALIAEAKKTVDAAKPKEPKIPKEPREAEPETPPEWKELVRTAEAVVKLIDIREPPEPIKVPTVRPLRQLIKEGIQAPSSPLARFNKLISDAERLAGPQKQAAQRAIAQQLPPELQALVDKTERIVKRMGATDRQRAELQAAAEATAGLDGEGSAYVLGRAYQMALRAGRTIPDWMFWLRNNWLLSGPITHTFYTFINTFYGAIEHVVSPFVAAAIDKVRGGQNVFFGEPFAALLGFGHAVPGAMRAALKAAETGLRVPLESELSLAARGELSPQAKGAQVPYLMHTSPDWGVIKAAADWLGVPMKARNAAELIGGGAFGRFANMQHTFFKVLNEGAQAHRNAYVATVKEGKSPLTSSDFVDRYKYHLQNPTDDVLRDNVNAGFAGTFMEKLGQKTQRLASALKDTPLRWEFPFLHVPLNISRAGIRYSPLAIFGPEMQAELLGQKGGRAQAMALSRVVTGTAVLSYIMSQALGGQATGDYPMDPHERKRWKDLGIQPNSVQIGGYWVSYNRWGPARIPMTIGANIGQLIAEYKGDDDKAMAKLIGGGIGATVHALGDEAGMLAMAQLFQAMEGARSAAQFGAGELASFGPYSVGSGQIAAFNDPYLREVRSVMDGIKYRIPGMRETLLPKRDIFGQPQYNPAYHSILRMSPVASDPVTLELDRLGIYPATLPNRIGGIQLTPELYDEYQAKAGAYARAAVEGYIQHPGWHNLPQFIQEQTLRAQITAAHKRAAAQIQAQQIGTPQDIIKQGVENKIRQIRGEKPVKKLESAP